MKHHTVIFGETSRRWFNKVLKQAAAEINLHCDSVNPGAELKTCANYDQSSGAGVAVERAHPEDADVFAATVIYSTKNWESLAQAVPICVPQMASAVVALGNEEFRNELLGRFEHAQIPLVPVTQRSGAPRERGILDGYLYLPNTQSDGHDSFFTLVDELDRHLITQSLGEVSGNSFSVVGGESCIDFCGINMSELRRSIGKFLAGRGITEYRITEG